MAGPYSDDLRHFPKHDPAPIAEKTGARLKLHQDIDDYLAHGGVITEHGTESGVHYPKHRTRIAQINFIKDRAYTRFEMRTRTKK